MTSGKNDPRPSVPPAGAAQVGQDLLAQLHKDFVVEKKSVPAADRKVADAAKGAQLGQDLLAQFAHDFGEKRRADDANRLHALGQDLLGAVARDFGSVRPPSMNVPGTGPFPVIPVIPGAPKMPSFEPPPALSSSASSSGSIAAPANVAPPPGYTPPMGRPVSLAAPPSAELVKAEEELAKLESAPLADDEAAEVEAMQGKGALGFFKKLFRRS